MSRWCAWPPGVGMQTILLRLALMAGLWWLLSEGSADGFWLGAGATILAVWLSLYWLPPGHFRIQPFAVIPFLAYFFWNSLRGATQVARLALKGRTALRPRLLTVVLDLPPGIPQVLFVSAVGLMPGTLSVHLDGDSLHLHVLDERMPILAEVRTLEARIARLFGEKS